MSEKKEGNRNKKDGPGTVGEELEVKKKGEGGEYL